MAIEEGKHVMLSYQWNSQKIVSKIYDILDAEGIKLWMDIKGGMKDDKYKSMSEAVANAAVVCCFLTPDYQASPDCQRELKRTADLETKHAKNKEPGKLRIIPCMLVDKKNPKWEPSEWLDIIIAGKLQIRMKDDSDTSVEWLAQEIIRRIRSEPSKPTIKQTSAPTNIFDTIRKKYLQDNRIKRIVNEEKSFPIEQSYINLAMVETKEQQEKEKKLKEHDEENQQEHERNQNYYSKQHNHEILGSYEEIYGAKTSIDVTKIFEECKDQTNKVLVLGRAGIGKSTFCQYVTYRWAKREIWTQYDLVVLIRLRKLTDSRYPSKESYLPIDLVKKEYFPFHDLSKEEKGGFQKQCNTGKVLWILDGYDEFVQSIPEQLQDAFTHILDMHHHILTSRPYAIALSYDVKMEIVGFTDDNITQYIEQFFEQIQPDTPSIIIQGQKLLTFLKINPNIWGIAHIPVNLELICSLWSNNNWSETKILTVTALYDNIIEWLCRRHLRRKNINDGEMTKQAVYKECDAELQFLEHLAFKAMESNKIVVPPDFLEETENETECFLFRHPQLLNMGILKSYNDRSIGNQNQTRKHHYFVHLSFQEHFAARHILRTLKNSKYDTAKPMINNNKYKQHFQLVFIFASGLLAQSHYKPCMEAFWTTIQGEPLDLIGIKHIKLIIECIDELGDQTIFRERIDYLKSISDWLNICFSENAIAITNNLLQSLQRTNSLLNKPLIQNKLIQLMTTSHTVTKQNAYYLISGLNLPEPTLKIISTIHEALQDKDSYVRLKASEALGKMGEKADTNAVIAGLLNALQDEDPEVRRAASEALGNMGEKAATNEVIAGLLNTLQDEDLYVRRAASEALGKMGEKAATNEVIGGLLTALRDEDSDVRQAASDAFGKLGTKAATNEVIAGLLNTLGDEYSEVQETASRTLGNIGEKAATNEVIAGLLNALRDEDSDVRRKASEALGTMGEKAATNEVIAGLLNTLQDEDLYVRRAASEALGNMGEKAATNEVIGGLLTALRGEDREVREAASEALGKMGEKAATNEVIAGLLNALGDEELFVREAASKALGKMGEKAATNEVIAGLLNALRDEYSNVRQAASRTLGKMGEKAATNEVIDDLLNALQDEDPEVREAASEGLGKMREKAATNEVIAGLLNVLGDEELYVQWAASEALGKMGEKVATNEVIAGLLNALRDEDSEVREAASRTLGKIIGRVGTSVMTVPLLNQLIENIDAGVSDRVTDALESALCSYRTLKELDTTMVFKLYSCIRQCQNLNLIKVAPAELIRVFLESRNEVWLPLIRYVALVQGIAVTVVKNGIQVHDVKGVQEIDVCLPELIEPFKKGIIGEEG